MSKAPRRKPTGVKKRAKGATSRNKRQNVTSDVCFVIMPFGGWLDAYYSEIYSSAIIDAGLVPKRADDLFRPSTIVHDIWAYTKQAKVLLADLTGKNANVFYELGLAHALAKPAILIAESMDDIPFDLRALRIITFDKNEPAWGEKLKSRITTSLKEVLIAPAEAVLPAFLNVSNQTAKPTVSEGQKDLIEMKQELDLLRREIRSRADTTRPRPELRPQEADTLMSDYVRRGLSEDQIVDRLRPLGVPPAYVRVQLPTLKRMQSKRVGLDDLLRNPTKPDAKGESEKGP